MTDSEERRAFERMKCGGFTFYPDRHRKRCKDCGYLERIAQLEADLATVKKELSETRTFYINKIEDERAAAWEADKELRRNLATARAAMGPLGTPPLPNDPRLP